MGSQRLRGHVPHVGLKCSESGRVKTGIIGIRITGEAGYPGNALTKSLELVAVRSGQLI